MNKVNFNLKFQIERLLSGGYGAEPKPAAHVGCPAPSARARRCRSGRHGVRGGDRGVAVDRMAKTVPQPSPEPPGPSGCIHTEAVAALHLLALRRQFDKIHQLFGEEPPHRSREVLWAALEVAHAHLRGERIGLRDLVARAERLVSAPTLSRVVAEAERAGLLTSEPAPEHGRMKLLHPTERTLGLLAARAEAAFAQFAAIVREAEGRLADAGAAGQQSRPRGRRGSGRPPGQALPS